MSDIQRKWYALYTRPRNEKKVNEICVKRGITSYVPLRREIRQWSDRRKKVELPAIASYVFVNLNYRLERSKLYEVPGILCFVSRNYQPLEIPESEIELMRRTVESQMQFDVQPSAIVKGTKVMVMSGPLCGTEGIVTDFTSKKINLLLPATGFTFVVDLAGAEIEVIK